MEVFKCESLNIRNCCRQRKVSQRNIDIGSLGVTVERLQNRLVPGIGGETPRNNIHFDHLSQKNESLKGKCISLCNVSYAFSVLLTSFVFLLDFFFDSSCPRHLERATVSYFLSSFSSLARRCRSSSAER